MRDPNSAKFKKWTELMMTGQMVGQDAPVTRLSFAKRNLHSVYSTKGPWKTLLGDPYGYTDTTRKIDPSEMEWGQPNLISCEINRTLGQDAATCTLKLVNVWATEARPEGLDTLMRPGFFTPDRGDTHSATRSLYDAAADPASHTALPGKTFPTDWGYQKNLWHDFLIPNTIVRTWQGYGSDNNTSIGIKYVHDPAVVGYVPPWDDGQLMCTGTWLIDRVTFSTDYTITVECRDFAKLLLEQFIYPPMLPMSRFPLIYCPDYGSSGQQAVRGKNTVRGMSRSSNDPWLGFNAREFGHRPSDAFDGRAGTYWLSVGNDSPNSGYSYEYITAATGGDLMNQVELDLAGGNYRVYVSVMENGVWQGGSTVPYNPKAPPAFPNGANVRYVTSVTTGHGSVTIHLPRAYKAQYVRVCFTNLWNSGLGQFPYRAGVREMRTRYQTGGNYVPGTIGKPGYIHDWMDVVKELACWAGFTWCNAPTPDPLIGTATAGGNNPAHYRAKPLRVWGDIEATVGPIVCTNADYFVNKSFMEGIKQVADMLGNIVMVDEGGGIVCRQPNIWAIGNFIDDPEAAPSTKAYLKGNYIEFHENANLITYSATIDDTDVRSEIEVIGMYPGTNANAVPVAGGATLDGHSASAINFTNVLAGQTRLFVVPGDASALLRTPIECQRMAELAALAILMNYRKGQVHAPCHPGLQVDDQVRIYERTTNESNLHYVSGIRTSHNILSGEFTMDVDTHWLGTSPKGAGDWFTNKIRLTPAVLQLPNIIARINKYGTDNRGEQQQPYDFGPNSAAGIPAGYGYGQNPLPSSGVPTA